jgi:PAS domain S-box-containing protein/diguanylate cyclase (GGDEF)-like protein
MSDSKNNDFTIHNSSYNQRKIDAIYKNSPLIYITWDKDGEIIDLNQYAIDLLGWKKNEIINKEFISTLISKADRNLWLKWKDGKINSLPNNFRSRLIKKDGTTINCSWTNVEIDKNENKVEIISIAKNLTKNVEHEIEMFKLVKAINETDNWVVITDDDGIIEYVNTTVKEITGYNREEVIGEKPSLFKSDKHNKSYYKNLWETIKSGKVFNDVIINQKKNDKYFYSEQTITPIKNNNNEIVNFISVGRDITQNKKMLKQIEYISNYDMIFGLPNRRYIESKIDNLIELNKKEEKIAVLIIKFDKIKYLNDIYNSSENKGTLINLAADLINLHINDKNNCVKIDENNSLAYLGGDNFALIIDDIKSTNEIYKIVKKILELFTDTINYNQETFMLNARIGVAVYPDDSENAQKLLSNSEIALLNIKNNDYAFFNQEMNYEIKKFNKMEARLDKAIKNNSFLIYYQPYYKKNEHSLFGMEALLRLQDPDLGIIYPSEFIPVLESSQLIKKVGLMVISKVVNSVRKWIKSGYEVVPISINLSPKQIEDSEHLQKIYQIIDDSGIDNSLINFEITETSAMSNVDYSLKVMEKMKEKGFSILIDDFGTGYSSLNYLQKFPLDYLKIDISFIRNMTKSSDGRNIVESIINIAHLLNLETIAEGVEKEIEVKELNKMDNDYIQGYYFAYPMTEKKIEKIYS